jgi:glutamate-1-semialdehyde 2,1-aminomutase
LTTEWTWRNYSGSVRLYAEACKAIAGGVNSNFRLWGEPVPLFFERGKGPYLFDVDGNRYIDYALGMGAAILGHAPEPVVRAVTERLPLGQVFAGQHPLEVELAQLFCKIVPCAELVRFGLSGSEMVQAALRLARAFTGRGRIVKFEGHYHGWFDTILVSVAPPLDIAGPPEEPTSHLPSAGQSRAAAEDVVVLPWNNLNVLEGYLARHWRQVAAVIMEPVMCNTGVIFPRPGYLEGVRALCDRYGVVLIFDEVITGFRLAPGGAQERLGIIPDLAVFGKALGAGFPIAALAGKRDLMELIATGRVLHGGTFNANLISVAAAVASLRELDQNREVVYGRLMDLGERLMAGLRAAGHRLGLPLRVDGIGAVFHTAFGGCPEITDYRSYCTTDAGPLRTFVNRLQHAGVRPTVRGTWFLSTAHTDAEVVETLRAADWALATLAEGKSVRKGR